MYVALAGLLLLCSTLCFGQKVKDLFSLADADSNFVRKYIQKNDFRIFYGGQGNNIAVGSKRDQETHLNGDLYANTNDYLGAGITYKWIDGDISFALPGTTYLKEERSNLQQFKLALSSTLRKLAFRAYYTNSKGVLVSDTEGEFESQPSLHEIRTGVQIIYLFNSSRYSYRASMYQSEYQLRTAGSFLLRLEPFYRSLGTKQGSMIPAENDLSARFGQQVGLEYVKAPGLLIMPGYGINIVIPDTKFFISPIVFAGLGMAHNKYKTTSTTDSFNSIEYAGHIGMNAGYNGNRHYLKVSCNWSAGYTLLDPTYLTNTNLTIVLMAGIRFDDLKSF